MDEKKRVPVIIPEGVPWPEGVPVPEIEVETVTIRKTAIDENGKIVETVSTVDMPVIP